MSTYVEQITEGEWQERALPQGMHYYLPFDLDDSYQCAATLTLQLHEDVERGKWIHFMLPSIPYHSLCCPLVWREAGTGSCPTCGVPKIATQPLGQVFYRRPESWMESSSRAVAAKEWGEVLQAIPADPLRKTLLEEHVVELSFPRLWDKMQTLSETWTWGESWKTPAK